MFGFIYKLKVCFFFYFFTCSWTKRKRTGQNKTKKGLNGTWTKQNETKNRTTKQNKKTGQCKKRNRIPPSLPLGTWTPHFLHPKCNHSDLDNLNLNDLNLNSYLGNKATVNYEEISKLRGKRGRGGANELMS